MLDDRPYMRTTYRSGWSVTTTLLVANVVCFLLQAILERQGNGNVINRLFALSPWGLSHGYVWQLITFQFLHGGLLHLLGNCLGLFFFGRAIESMMGSKSMLKLYFLSGTVGGLLQVGLGYAFPEHFGAAVVGASAGVFGLIAAFATRAPDQIITLLIFFILPVSFKAKTFIYLSIGLAVYGMVFDSGGIAHAAHLAGIFIGIAYVRWFPRLPTFSWRPRIRSRSSQDSESELPPWSKVGRKGDEVPPAEFISREVDPILEKISKHGIHSLTAEERRILEAARSRMARR